MHPRQCDCKFVLLKPVIALNMYIATAYPPIGFLQLGGAQCKKQKWVISSDCAFGHLRIIAFAAQRILHFGVGPIRPQPFDSAWRGFGIVYAAFAIPTCGDDCFCIYDPSVHVVLPTTQVLLTISNFPRPVGIGGI